MEEVVSVSNLNISSLDLLISTDFVHPDYVMVYYVLKGVNETLRPPVWYLQTTLPRQTHV